MAPTSASELFTKAERNVDIITPRPRYHGFRRRLCGLQLRVRGGQGDTRLEMAEHREVVAIIFADRIELKGNIHIRGIIDFDFEIGTDYANDFVTFAAQRDALSDYLGIAAARSRRRAPRSWTLWARPPHYAFPRSWL
jgi:hypothetical protein